MAVSRLQACKAHSNPCQPLSDSCIYLQGKYLTTDRRAGDDTDTPHTNSPRSEKLHQDNGIASDRVFKGIGCQIEHVTLRSFFVICVAGGEQATQH